MTALRLQGWLFCTIAIGVAGVALAVGDALTLRFGSTTGLLLAVLILLLGVPHGAFDTVFAKKLHGVHGWLGWLVFSLAYLSLSLLVLLAWHHAPSLFLTGFLILSALHFSGDLATGTHFVARLLYGGTMMVLPALLHENEMARLFSFLVAPQAALALAAFLHEISWPWLLATTLAAAWQMRTHYLSGFEMAAAALLALLAPPLLAFTVFFCTMHSARHIVRTWHYAGTGSVAQLSRAALLPMLGTLILGGAAAYFLRTEPLEAGVMQLVFVGLAALTVPHMALVEQVRWRN